MNNPISRLKKEFESRVKLGIMSILMVNEKMDYNDLKDILELTDGNLASHLKSLENLGYLHMKKTFEGRKTRTTYTASPEGRLAFEEHLNALEELVRQQQPS
jgi:DNA-binding MarR family transcriptional regulator